MAQSFDRPITFPDIPGYQTLKVDLHMHTVFSDGSVWPDIRVREAVRDGLDAIAMTDHIEYQPHEADIPHPDRNRSYEIAVELAARLDSNLMVIRGSEITRSMPPGHSNAVFLDDVNPMIQDEPLDVFREAARQNAFTFWNHPMWLGQRKDGVAVLTDMHRDLIAQGLLQGIEVVNMHDYSAEALQIALDNDLTIIGTSDIHSLIQWEFEHDHNGHRPITLVFTTDRSQEGLHRALMAGRTVVWFRNMLVGRDEYLVPLIESSLTLESAAYAGERSVLEIVVHNASDVNYILRSESGYTFHQNSDVVMVKPNGNTTLHLKTLEQLEEVVIPFTVLNAVNAPDRHPVFVLDVAVN
jgi:predicted metal-dependent phosphoesterase TrpH